MRIGKMREQQQRLRQQRRQRAAELVRIGLTHKQIAERLGSAASTVAELLAEGSNSGGYRGSVTHTEESGKSTRGLQPCAFASRRAPPIMACLGQVNSDLLRNSASVLRVRSPFEHSMRSASPSH